MQGALVAYHNTQKVFGFEYIGLEDMEKRVFGCPEFSDVVFKSSLSMVEKIFDYILEDQD
jgi:Mitochondrial protein Pet127